MVIMKNPIVNGYYADPEARFYEGKYWIYVTGVSGQYGSQINLTSFSSADLKTWQRHDGIVKMSDFPWAVKDIWAPTIIEKNGKYYLMFASNDILESGAPGGLELAVADSPEGPFKGMLGRPFLNRFINKAQPIDAHFFKDDDGQIYLYYGGWAHCNVAKMKEDMTDAAEDYKEITPEGYIEGPCMLKRGGVYYFMWSSGCWKDETYKVMYSTAKSPYGPFDNAKTILKAQAGIADGPGHHGFIKIEGTEDYLIVYHRREIGDLESRHRFLCIDRLDFEDDHIKPIIMTK